LDRVDPGLKHAITPPAFEKGKLHREELVDRLHAAVEKPLVVVAAPAGYGKTTLLADFTANTDLRVCWVRLGGESHDPVSIARLTMASLRNSFRRTRNAAEPRFSLASPPEAVARVLSSWIESEVPDSFVLAIDDVHDIGEGGPSLAFLDEFLLIRPNSLTLIASGRAVPELSLARLLAQGQLAGFGPHDLAFTRDEIAALSSLTLRRDIDPEEVERIYQTSKGWATGVMLSAVLAGETLSRLGQDPGPLIHDYLSSVVLNRLPDGLRRFTLDASVLPVMTAELCDLSLQRDDSDKMLAQLRRRGVFIDVSAGNPPIFSFQDMFREFLGETLLATDSARQDRLRQRAGGVLEREGAIEAAFRLYVEAREYERASRLADANAKAIYLSGRWETLEAWYNSLRGYETGAPNLLLYVATASLSRGDLDSAERIALNLDSSEGLDGPTDLRARLSNLRAAILYARGSFDACISVAETVTAMESALERPAVLAIALETIALGLVAKRERLAEALQCAESAVRLLDGTGDGHSLARSLGNLAVVLEASGNYRGAAEAVEKASALIKDAGSSNEVAIAVANLALAKHRQGDLESALTAYADALKSARQAANSVVEAYILLGQADVFCDLGMAMQSAQAYEEALAIAMRLENRQLIEYGCLRTAVLYRRRGNIIVGKDWLQRVLEVEERTARRSRTAIELAALEVSSAPRNAISSLMRILKAHVPGVSGEDEVAARLHLARAHFSAGDTSKCIQVASDMLARTGQMGTEQFVAAELSADMTFRDALASGLPGNPVLDVVQGRIATLASYRRLHASDRDDEPEVRPVRASALGRTLILQEGRPLKGLKKQAKEIFLFLADRKLAPKDLIAELFWPDYGRGRRAANTHTAIHSIRSVIGKSAITLEDDVYSLGLGSDFSYDVDEFLRAAEVAERLSAGDPRRLFALTEAVRLYGGPFVPNSTSPWVLDRRRELEAKYLDLISALASEALVRDQPQRVLDQLRRGLAIDPLRDDFNLRYLEALARLGQVSEVSLHYQRYARLVRDELGIDPPDELRKLYARLIG